MQALLCAFFFFFLSIVSLYLNYLFTGFISAIYIGCYTNMGNVLAAGCRRSNLRRIALRLPVMTDDLDMNVVVAALTRVNVDTTSLSKGQEGAETQQVDCGDEGKDGRPRARCLDEIPREIHHEDP